MKLSKEYIAGFVDGEGYLGIRKHSRDDVRFGFHIQLSVKIAQRLGDEMVLYELKKLYDGHISKTRKPKNPQQCPSVCWEISGTKRVKKFIEDLLPYLVVKKKQALVLLEFIKIGRVTSYDKAKEIQEKRLKLYEEIRRLNARGLAETERRGRMT